MQERFLTARLQGWRFFRIAEGCRGLRGEARDERRLREENTARNPWKLPPRLTHDAKSLNFIAFSLSPFRWWKKIKGQKRMSIIALRFLASPKIPGDTWHLPKTAIKIRKHVSYATENEGLSYANIRSRKCFFSVIQKYCNIIDNIAIFHEIFFFSSRNLFTKSDLDKYISCLSFYIQFLNFSIKYLFRYPNVVKVSLEALLDPNVNKTRLISAYILYFTQ